MRATPEKRALALALLAFSAGFVGGCRAQELIEPDVPFDGAPPAPDYHDYSHWAALPWVQDHADRVPDGETDGQQDAAVDVFFVHPTTFYDSKLWNAPLVHRKSRERVDNGVLPNQAGAFNAAARVFVPRYRQATLGAFTTDDYEDADAALDLAYGDVLAAFRHYVSEWNDGRPFILASHSQGTAHALRLLAEEINGKELGRRLVAAYLVGIAIGDDVFDDVLPGMQACTTAEQTGCVLSWNSVVEGADLAAFRGRSLVRYPDGRHSNAHKRLLCTNPVSWLLDGPATQRTDHAGAVRFRKRDSSPRPDMAYLSAECRDGLLHVQLPDRKYRFFGKNLHIVDYSLFYMDIRRNAVARAQAFVEQRAVPAAPSETRE